MIPPPHVEIVHTVQVPQKRGICFHVDKPCFTLDPPKSKKKTENTFRTSYYIQRMKAAAKSAQSPDMNMSLNEIRTGITRSERIKFSLLIYLIGVLAIFATFNR